MALKHVGIVEHCPARLSPSSPSGRRARRGGPGAGRGPSTPGKGTDKHSGVGKQLGREVTGGADCTHSKQLGRPSPPPGVGSHAAWLLRTYWGLPGRVPGWRGRAPRGQAPAGPQARSRGESAGVGGSSAGVGTGLPGLEPCLGTCGPRSTRPRRRGRALRGWAPPSSLDGGGPHNSQWGTGLGWGALRSRAPTSPPGVEATGISRGRQRTNQKKPACCGGHCEVS